MRVFQGCVHPSITPIPASQSFAVGGGSDGITERGGDREQRPLSTSLPASWHALLARYLDTHHGDLCADVIREHFITMLRTGMTLTQPAPNTV